LSKHSVEYQEVLERQDFVFELKDILEKIWSRKYVYIRDLFWSILNAVFTRV
jgi:hypothetical protein